MLFFSSQLSLYSYGIISIYGESSQPFLRQALTIISIEWYLNEFAQPLTVFFQNSDMCKSVVTIVNFESYFPSKILNLRALCLRDTRRFGLEIRIFSQMNLFLVCSHSLFFQRFRLPTTTQFFRWPLLVLLGGPPEPHCVYVTGSLFTYRHTDGSTKSLRPVKGNYKMLG